jgi:hypothetical protein
MKSSFGEGYYIFESKMASDKVLNVTMEGDKTGSIALN